MAAPGLVHAHRSFNRPMNSAGPEWCSFHEPPWRLPDVREIPGNSCGRGLGGGDQRRALNAGLT